MVLIWVAAIAFVLLVVAGSMYFVRRTGYYTGPIFMSPLRYFRLADTPLRVAQIVAGLALIPYLVLAILGDYDVAQLLFGVYLVVAGSLYRKSRGFLFSKLNPKWIGTASIAAGIGEIVLHAASLAVGSHSIIGQAALAFAVLSFFAGIGAIVMSFRRPVHY